MSQKAKGIGYPSGSKAFLDFGFRVSEGWEQNLKIEVLEISDFAPPFRNPKSEIRNKFYLRPMKLDIIYQDDQIVVVNKPAELLTIPDRHDATKPSLYGELNKIFGKVFIVHRLDRETSGILVFALNEDAHRDLSMQFENKETRKVYLAILDGSMHADDGEINKPIAEHTSVPGRMVVAKRGKESLTLFRVVERFKHFTLVEADIRTGRTHQIRVHFQSISYPLDVELGFFNVAC